MTVRVNAEQSSKVGFRQVSSLNDCQSDHAYRLWKQHVAVEVVFTGEDGDLVRVDQLGLDGLRDHAPDHPVEAGEVEEIGGAVEVKVEARGLEEHDLD